MTCISCTPTKSIPSCIDDLIIGTGVAATDYVVYVENLTTGYIYAQEVTSDGSGLITLDTTLPDKSFYNKDSSYNLWVGLPGGSPNDMEEITIDGTGYTCFLLTFIDISSNNGLESFTLEIDD